jgi:cytoskeletal protein CcmA (bactofilin family)
MKKKSLAALGIGGLLIFILGFVSVGHAQEFRRGNSATIASNEKVDSSAYLAGRSIDVAGEVNGDLFCAGQNITISGTIHGDVICAGQTITISGRVDGDARLAGQTIAINSTINNNLTVAGQDFSLNSTGKVGQDITGGVENMTINGDVGRDLVLGATNAVIHGTIGRNIKSQVNKLDLASGAKVGGDINYASNNQLSKAPSAAVSGSIHRTQPVEHKKHSGWFGIGFRIYWFFAALLVALVLVLLFPSVFEGSARLTMASFGKTLLLGVAALLFTPVIFVLLMITVVGIPLGIILMLAWLMALILSGPFFAYLLGKEIWRAQKNPIWIMLVGAVILLLAYNIPFIGPIFMLAALFIGMGMLVRQATIRTPKPIYKIK